MCVGLRLGMYLTYRAFTQDDGQLRSLGVAGVGLRDIATSRAMHAGLKRYGHPAHLLWPLADSTINKIPAT